MNDSIATVCSPFPRQNTVLFYYLSRCHLFLLLSLCLPFSPAFSLPLSHSSAPWNLGCPSMFKTHYMWPPGIYSAALPVTPFRAGVPREHGEMSSFKAWKRDEEKGTVREGESGQGRTREIDTVKSAGNKCLWVFYAQAVVELRWRWRSRQVEGDTGGETDTHSISVCVCVCVYLCVIHRGQLMLRAEEVKFKALQSHININIFICFNGGAKCIKRKPLDVRPRLGLLFDLKHFLPLPFFFPTPPCNTLAQW